MSDVPQSPWLRILQEGKVQTVVVLPCHLQDFNTFIEAVERERIGIEVGGFKIVFDEGVVITKNVLRIVKKFNKLFKKSAYKQKLNYDLWEKAQKENNKEKKEELLGQTNDIPGSPSKQILVQVYPQVPGCYRFVHGGSCGAFGDGPSPAEVDEFLEAATKAETYDEGSAVGPCCSDAREISVSELSKHLWAAAEEHSIPDSSEDSSSFASVDAAGNDDEDGAAGPSNPKKQKRVKAERGKAPASQPTASAGTSSSRPSSPSSGHQKKPSLLYGARVQLELLLMIVANFCISRLGTCLDESGFKFRGIHYPYFYFGTKHSFFCWHIEDGALYSINYLHAGAAKVWYFVSPKNFQKLLRLIKEKRITLLCRSCDNSLGHKDVFICPHVLEAYDIEVHTIVQNVNEIVVTVPYGAHSSFNTGWNIAEAANFASPGTIPICSVAPSCSCYDHSIHFDFSKLIKKFRPELQHLYILGDRIPMYKFIHSDPHFASLDLVPQDVVTYFCGRREQEADGNDQTARPDPPPAAPTPARVVPGREVRKLSIRPPVPEVDNGTDDGDLRPFQSNFEQTSCFYCGLKTCNNHYDTRNALVGHMKRSHPDRSLQLVNNFETMYPRVQKGTGRYRCTICNWLSKAPSNYRQHFNGKHRDQPFVEPDLIAEEN